MKKSLVSKGIALLTCFIVCFFIFFTPLGKQAAYAGIKLLYLPLGLVVYEYQNITLNRHYKTVEKKLNNLPNVHVIKITQEREDDIVNVQIDIKNKGPLYLGDIREGSFDGTFPHIFLRRIKNWNIVTSCYENGVYRWGAGFDVGQSGKASRFFPFQLRTVEDVISHYNDILAIIENWPKNTDPLVYPTDKSTKFTENDCYVSLVSAK